MNAETLLNEGRLDDAVAAAIAGVKSRPNDLKARVFLAELFALAGDWDRALKHLDVAAALPEAEPTNVHNRQALARAEKTRTAFWEGSGPPPALGSPNAGHPELASRRAAVEALRAGNAQAAALALDESDAVAAPDPGGVRNGEIPFQSFRTIDDLLAPILEIVEGSGRYAWVAWSDVAELEVEPPRRLDHLIWARAVLTLKSGRPEAVSIPVRYPGTTGEGDPALRLGRATDWREFAPGRARGVGQVLYAVDDEARSIFELENVRFGDESNE